MLKVDIILQNMARFYQDLDGIKNLLTESSATFVFTNCPDEKIVSEKVKVNGIEAEWYVE